MPTVAERVVAIIDGELNNVGIKLQQSSHCASLLEELRRFWSDRLSGIDRSIPMVAAKENEALSAFASDAIEKNVKLFRIATQDFIGRVATKTATATIFSGQISCPDAMSHFHLYEEAVESAAERFLRNYRTVLPSSTKHVRKRKANLPKTRYFLLGDYTK